MSNKKKGDYEITTAVFMDEINKRKEARSDPAKPRLPFFIVLRGPNIGQFFLIPDKSEISIGRATKNDICIKEESVSRNHCKLIRQGNSRFEIVDLQSANGIYANGHRVERHLLQDGDKIQLGRVVMLKFNFQDDIEQAYNRELYMSTTKDALTNIYSKRYFLEQLQNEYTYHRRRERPLTLCIFDIDHFKAVNDTHGHMCGDYVLQTLAQSVSTLIRRGDTFARFGGEEFVVLLRDTDEKGATHFAERLRKRISETPFIFEFKTFHPTVSIGIASTNDPVCDSPEALIKEADRYLYQAKQNGRNRIESKLTAAAPPSRTPSS